MYDLIIKNGTIVSDSKVYVADVCISEGKIADICENTSGHDAASVIDASGKYLFPGFIDAHSHLNDPGLTNSEDLYTGTCSAVAGGITTVLEHPLTFPLPDNLKSWSEKKEIGESKVVCDFALFGACSPGNEEEILKMMDAGAVAFKTFMTYSSEIPMLNDGQLFERMKFMADKNTVLAIHCENNDICNYYTEKMTAEGKIQHKYYPAGRPDIAEIDAVSRVSLFAQQTGCKINIAHCSLKGAVDAAWDQKAKGADITIETCPHYLILNETDIEKFGVFGICNPPLRSKEEVEKLWTCVFDGKIDWVCSDHCAYTIDEKMAGKDNCFKTPAGITGIETCFPLFYSEGVEKRGLPVTTFADMSSTNQAKRYGLYPQKGTVSKGSDADITILDPEEVWNIKTDQLKYMIKWGTYEDKEVKGRVNYTIVGGKVAYKVDEVCAEKGSGKFVAPVKG